jgi:hypothetical protein
MIGVLNLVLAMMPQRIESELGGHLCSGDKDLGITYLLEAVEGTGVQQKLACIVSIVAVSLVPGSDLLSNLAKKTIMDKHSEVCLICMHANP